MDSMMELVNALNALTAVLQKFTQQTTENYLNTFEELPTGDTDDAPAAESFPAGRFVMFFRNCPVRVRQCRSRNC